MKQSLRARRMERSHKRSKSEGKLSLVSLMDIFTILVFFLLVNSSDVEVLQTSDSITLPKSVAEQKPESTLVIMVNDASILVNGRKIANTAEVTASDEPQIVDLKTELDYYAARQPLADEEAREETRQAGRDITIMGDKGIPYSLLKKIMATCAQTDYRNISLAVNHIIGEATEADGNTANPASAPAVEG